MWPCDRRTDKRPDVVQCVQQPARGKGHITTENNIFQLNPFPSTYLPRYCTKWHKRSRSILHSLLTSLFFNNHIRLGWVTKDPLHTETSQTFRALILFIQTSALYKSFTYWLTYLLNQDFSCQTTSVLPKAFRLWRFKIIDLLTYC